MYTAGDVAAVPSERGMTSAAKDILERKDRMNDHAKIQVALSQAILIIADHFEPGLPRDPMATIKRLLEVLNDQELAAAIGRSEQSNGLRVVK
jgi:hypothetical protein